MSVAALNSSSLLYGTSPLTGVQGACGTTPTQGSAAGSGGGDSQSISPFGQLLSNLLQLQQKDPNQLQQVLSQIANQVQTAAQAQGQTPQGQILSQIANRFQSASQTGDLTQLQGHHGGGHHHHRGAQAYGQTQQASQQSLLSPQQSGNQQPSSAGGIQGILSTLFAQVNASLGG